MTSTSSNSRFKVPAPVYYLGVAVLLIAAITAIVLLARHEADAYNRPGVTYGKEPPAPDFNGDPAPAQAQVQPWLIDGAVVTDTHSGLELTGTLTPDAELNPNTATSHINALLADHCLNTVSLQTQDNMQFDLFGFCHSSMDPAAMSALYSAALNDDADAVTVLDFPGEARQTRAEFVWFTDSTAEQKAIVDSWDSLSQTLPKLRLITLTAYGPDGAQTRDLWSRV
ncbi:hypothetical protein [Corynebacterium lubricantis]|uniref:hypothetical protein n=1 Tax=Corynebacterium lubricantis TaxID=541095 RepID=UPI0003662FC6|nr:hypothetical protein [Corynebacterium lubricantis]